MRPMQTLGSKETLIIAPTTEAIAEPELAGLGEVLKEYGYSLRAVTVEDPAPPGRIYEPTEGKKLVAVEIIVGNVSGKQIGTNPMDATLIDKDGFAYRCELAGRDGQLELVDLDPGEKVKGWIAFEIPPRAIPASIKYEMIGYPTIVLEVGLD